mmetsp:Transcript_93301/g.260861  ORF Transcript_93301/g.260861 Transcript_93301/m.260861 type:complete len:280 (-) Transcript_93301:185-1024(-)
MLLTRMDGPQRASKMKAKGLEEAPRSVWSRDTSTDSSSGEAHPTRSPVPQRCRDAAPSVTRASALELVGVVVRRLGFAATLAEPCARSPDGAPRIRAVSKGFEELCEWPERALAGGSGRMLDPQEEDMSVAEKAKLRLAQESGAPFSCFRTLRKASGELCRVFFHVRGLSLGKDVASGREVWYVVTTYVDVTETEYGRAVAEDPADVPLLEEAGQAIARCIRSDVAQELAERSELAHSLAEEEGEESHGSEDGRCLVWLAAPSWKEGDVDAALEAAGLY